MNDEKYLEEQEKLLKKYLDDRIKLEDDIKEFARKASTDMLSSFPAQVVTPFRNKEFLVSARVTLKDKVPIMEVKIRDWFEVKVAANPSQATSSSGTGILSEKINSKDMLYKIICVLMFDMYGLVSNDQVGEE